MSNPNTWSPQASTTAHATHSAAALLLTIRSVLNVPPDGDLLEAVRGLVAAQHAPAATEDREALLRVLLAAQAWIAADLCAYALPDALPAETPAPMRAQLYAVAREQAEGYALSLRKAVVVAERGGGGAA